jgi:hypothetical protein
MELRALEQSTARWRAGVIGDAAYAGLYFLHWQAATHGRRFASRRSRTDPKPDASAWFQETRELKAKPLADYLSNYFRRYQFFGVISNVPHALAAWLQGDWPLTFCAYIPSPAEVLAMQVAGTRPVTVLSAWPRLLEPVLSKPNAFAFMVHDLEHAFKFFHDPAMHSQQRDFFQRLSTCIDEGQFDDYLNDPVFADKFDYLRSDMNTHAFHAGLYLRAILLEFHLRQAGERHPWELPPPVQNEVTALLVGLLGAECLDEMEKRMA